MPTVPSSSLPPVSVRNDCCTSIEGFDPAYIEIEAQQQQQQQQQQLWQDDTLDSVSCQYEWPSEILDPLMWSTQFYDVNTASSGGNTGLETFQ